MRRTRAFAWVAAAVLLGTAVVTLRVSSPPPRTPDDAAPLPSGPTSLDRFAADGVRLPEPGGAPAAAPLVVAFHDGADRLRVAWADALPGGTAPAGAAGYVVTWPGGERAVVAPEIELTWLDGVDVTAADPGVEVRVVDAHGRRSAPARAIVERIDDPADDPRLTGLLDRFDGEFSVDTAGPGGRWRLGGFPGCTEAGSAGTVLAIDRECGAELTMLRSRAPLRLAAGPGERGRVLVVTDAAGPRRVLTIDLVPGPADRVGSAELPPPGSPPNGSAVEDPALPAGAVRALVGDGGARVLTGPGVPALPSAPPAPGPAPARGVGVLHAFEVVLDDTGVHVLQDGREVAAAGVLPPWAEATLLVGIGGVPGGESRARVDAIGFGGEAVPVPGSYVYGVAPAGQRIVGPDQRAPGSGVWREPLAGAAAARLVATVRVAPGVDLAGLLAEVGPDLLPMRPVVPGLPAAPGADVTVAADLPASALAAEGPAALTPLVLRAPGAENAGREAVTVADAYFEITPGRCDGGPCPPRGVSTPAPQPATPAGAALPLPTVQVVDATGTAVPTTAADAPVLVDVLLDGLAAQLAAGGVEGVAGFQLLVDGRLVASVPTAADGPGVGGAYRVEIAARAVGPGAHTVELRVLPADGEGRPLTALASWRQG